MPETGSDSYKLARFEQKALKYGDSGRQLQFKSLEPATQHFLLDQTNLTEDELPAMGFFENEETWLLATTRKIVWSRPGYRHELPYGLVKNDGMTEMDALQQGKYSFASQDERSSKLQEIKGSSPWFYWEDEQGERFEALLPPGTTLFSIWNLVRYLSSLDRLHPPT